jgi:hypothetical protein
MRTARTRICRSHKTHAISLPHTAGVASLPRCVFVFVPSLGEAPVLHDPARSVYIVTSAGEPDFRFIWNVLYVKARIIPVYLSRNTS